MTEVRRKITTLMSADVVNPRGQLDIDASEALAVLEARRAIFNRLVRQYDGRQFGSVGGARMVEFPSARDALKCAIDIQRAVLDENDSLPDEKRIVLRIGLSAGDVIEDADGNLFGKGIGVANELQALAVPGGITLSGSVHDHLGHGWQLEFLSERKLKNIEDPVRIYQVIEPGIESGRQSVWTELKRRSVVRVGAAYAVVAWLLIQIADTILPTFDAPPWVMRGFVIFLVAAFPVSLFLAWIYELTPRGLVRDDEVFRQGSTSRLAGRRLDGAIIVMLAVACVYLVVNNWDSIQSSDENSVRESIAVLAFDNLSPDPANEYFSDGLAEEVLNILARIPELRVAARTSSFSFKGLALDAGTIAQRLMVENVLEGSVRADGDQIRVTATLIRNGSVRWTETYNRSLRDVLDVQAEIAYAVVTAIVPVLSPDSQTLIGRRPTDDVEAYDYYLRGLVYLNRPAEEESLAIAAGFFDQAIALDARFAAAWAARCEARLSQYEFTGGEETFFGQAETDCRRAWTLDNGLWEVYVALGRLYTISGQYDNAIVELRTAISRKPDAVAAYVELGTTLSLLKEPQEAESMFLMALAIDGSDWNVYRAYGHFLYDHERYDEAIAQYSRVIEFTPDSGVGFDNLGNAYWAKGDFEAAAEAFQRSLEISPSRWAYSSLGSMQYYLGDYAASVANQRQSINLAPEDHVAWGRLAEAYRFLPESEEQALAAFAEAIRLVEEHLQINPDNWDNLGLLAVYLAFSGREPEALRESEKMLAIAPEEPFAHYYHAIIQHQGGNIDGTYQSLEQALELGVPPVFVTRDPTLQDLRADNRFVALLSRYEDQEN